MTDTHQESTASVQPSSQEILDHALKLASQTIDDATRIHHKLTELRAQYREAQQQIANLQELVTALASELRSAEDALRNNQPKWAFDSHGAPYPTCHQ